MSYRTTLSSPVVGSIDLQLFPDYDNKEGYSIYIQTGAFTVNRIAFERAEIYYALNQEGGGLRQTSGLRTYLPGKVGSVVTSDNSRSKINNAVSTAIREFISRPDFKQVLAETTAKAREELAARIDGTVEALQKKIRELQALSVEAQDTSIPFGQTNAKYNSAIQRHNII